MGSIAKRTVAFSYLILILVGCFSLFFKVTMGKNEYYGLCDSRLYDALVWLSIVFVLVLNHFYNKYRISYNLVITCLLSRLSHYWTYMIFRMYRDLPLEKLLKKGLPQYWHWNLKWFELFVFALILIALSELFLFLLRKILKGKESLILRQEK